MTDSRPQSYNYQLLSTAETDSEETQIVDKRWAYIWRATNLVMTIFFVFAAYVQINDPDPYIWVPIYLLPAILTISISIKPWVTDTKLWKIATVMVIAVSIAGSMYLLAVLIEILSINVVNPLQHEEGREMAGLVIVILWLSICRFTSLGSNEPGQGSMNALFLLTGTLGIIPLALWSLCFISDWHKKIGHCKDMFPDWN